MKYIYVVLILHQIGTEITVENIKKVFEAIDVEYDINKIKALYNTIVDINIDEVLKTPLIQPVIKEPEPEIEEEEEEEKEEEFGLGSLFG